MGHLIIKKGHVEERATKSLIKCFCLSDSILTLLGLSLMLLTFRQNSDIYVMISTQYKMCFCLASNHCIVAVSSNEDDWESNGFYFYNTLVGGNRKGCFLLFFFT